MVSSSSLSVSSLKPTSHWVLYPSTKPHASHVGGAQSMFVSDCWVPRLLEAGMMNRNAYTGNFLQKSFSDSGHLQLPNGLPWGTSHASLTRKLARLFFYDFCESIPLWLSAHGNCHPVMIMQTFPPLFKKVMMRGYRKVHKTHVYSLTNK